ncbi:MAG: sugar ABC transporter permease [Lachnospiraceae bacterium]|jgi:multiple sugar transport system permease protein|nr:sugar ABC transporter permease [Lachnospiraceae bacterium]MCI8958135.1 sugar ABC transporter permease [Lachnospiraceae bacterium]
MNNNAKASKHARSESMWAYIMVAPTVIGLLVLNIYPFLDTIKLSFSKTRPFGLYELRGIQNYIQMFQSAEFWRANLNTLWFCVLTVPIGMLLSLVVAVMLNTKIKGRTFFRAVFFLPMVVAPAAVAMVWKWIFNTEYGILNTLLMHNINWITDPNIVMITCSIVAIWSAIGYDAVLLLSGLQNISQSYYEAASLDGATKIQQFFNITLPMVSPTLFVVLIMRLMSSIKVYDLIYMMIEEANPALTSAQSLMYLFYRESFVTGNKGLGSSVVIWTVAVIGLVTVVQFVGQKKWVNYEV